MFGHKWVQAPATIMADQTTEQGPNVEHEYVIDVQAPRSGVVQKTIKLPGGFMFPVGTVISVQYDVKSGEVRFDPDNQQVTLSAAGPARAAGFGAGGRGGLGAIMSAAAGGGGLMQVLNAALQASGSSAQLPPGAEPQIAALLQTMRSGDKSQRLAAITQLRQMAASLGVTDMAALGGLGGLGGLLGQAGGEARIPEMFGPGGPGPAGPGGPGAPAAPGPFGPAGAGGTGPASPAAPPGGFFGQVPPAGGQASPAAPPGGFGPGQPAGGPAAPPGGFFGQAQQAAPDGGGTGQAERLSRLQALHDQGLLSSTEFQAQRQRIIEET
jgi:hypothetical protein